MSRAISITLASIALIVLAGCGKKAPPLDEKEHLKVVVRADGAIFADGVQSDLADLSRRLDILKQKAGVVWYYRASPQGEPPPHSMAVMKLVVDKRLPIAMFLKEDFSQRMTFTK